MLKVSQKFAEMGSIILHFLTLISALQLSTSFTPPDNHLLNCGSPAPNTIVDNRNFTGDASGPGSPHLAAGKSIPLTNSDPASNSSPSSPLYGTARVFTSVSRYSFGIKKTGTHLVRLHFSPFISPEFNLKNASFSVYANGFSILSNFSVEESSVLNEFILMVDKMELDIMFIPVEKSGFGFVNAIEVISAPDDLIVNGGSKLITSNGIEEFNNLSSRILQTVHRINVGGSKLTPFNDTLWRSWVPDDAFLRLQSAAKRASSIRPPNYETGGASREIAPDNVYMTAKQMDRDNLTVDSEFNITWDFPVGGEEGVPHFVRLHFCDIISISLNQLFFNVYINGLLAYRDLDLSTLTFHVLAVPYYMDFVVNSDSSGILEISVGPSDLSSSLRKNAILNGVEIMKIVSPVKGKALSKRRGVFVLVGSSVGGFLTLCLVILAVLVVLRSRRRKKKVKPRRVESLGWTPLRSFHSKFSEATVSASPGMNGYQSLKIPFSDLQAGTNNFDKSLVIGSGGFGMVYKAILRDNLKVAVKRGVPGSRQGLPEFQTEITVLSRIRHRHLVSLVGYCEEQSEMILVYEYMEKGPLKNHLYGSGLPPLSWKQRLEICIGAARGLHYLHTGSAQGIIHRDIKSTNILLDENYVAKVADFGLSRSGPCLSETHVSTGVKGSFGYLDPEYFRRQQLTDKSDVYSFGVVLFEVLCARPAVDPLLAREEVNLGEWAIQWQRKGLLKRIIDPHLAGKINPGSLKKYGETAEKCLAEYGVDRPTMGDVLWNLEYALQLHENGNTRDDNGITAQDQVPTSSNVEDDADASSSGTRTSRIFSQLITNDGR